MTRPHSTPYDGDPRGRGGGGGGGREQGEREGGRRMDKRTLNSIETQPLESGTRGEGEGRKATP